MDEFSKGCLTDADILYHYCSMESFIKIIESKKIRLGNVMQMNDPTELPLRSLNWIELIYKQYEKDPFEFKFYHDKKELDMKQYLDLLNYHQDIIKTDSFFVFCMSTLADDLNQWRVYGANGNGVCLGFDVNDMFNLIEKDSNYTYSELEYEDLQRISELAVSSILNKIRDRFLAGENENLYNMLNNFYSDLEFFILRYKHPAYKAESEGRLIYRKHNFQTNNTLMMDEGLLVESNDLGIKTYKEITLSDMRIKSISFGPTNKVPLDNILLFLNKNEINLQPSQITYSNIPYCAK